MSYGREILADSAYDRQKAQERWEERSVLAEEGIWVTAKGERIPISEMNTKHIANCVALLDEDDPYYEIMNAEIMRRLDEYCEFMFRKERGEDV